MQSKQINMPRFEKKRERVACTGHQTVKWNDLPLYSLVEGCFNKSPTRYTHENFPFSPSRRNISNAIHSYSSSRPLPRRTGYRSSINSFSSLDLRGHCPIRLCPRHLTGLTGGFSAGDPVPRGEIQQCWKYFFNNC